MLRKIKSFLEKGHSMRIVSILCFLVIYISAHSALQNTPGAVANKKLIKLIQSDNLVKRIDFDPLVLTNNVILFHDGAHMYCDSAYLDEGTNSFEAFGQIKVNQGDTLFMYGKRMIYNGNNKLLQVRESVRLENRDVTLFTDSLDFDRIANIGYYFDGGMLVDSLNELTSYWGQYEPNIRMATFSDSVKLVNNKFTLHSYTLKYNTFTKIATILGKSTILSDSGTIYTQRGWYNTQTDESMLLEKSLVVNKDGNQTLTGDTIFFNRAKSYGEVFGNMVMQDSTKKVILHGHYGFYDDANQYAMATDSAWAVEYSKGDSLFLHADTLSIKSDSIYRLINAFHNVRFYRPDIQGVSDSMVFKTKDSILYLYKEPVLWYDKQQMSGDTIEVFLNDSTVDWVHMKQYCFAIEEKDSTHYNQLKGRDLKAYLDNREVRYIIVEGNVESIFYPEEKRWLALWDEPVRKQFSFDEL